jgi:hypothetical protein
MARSASWHDGAMMPLMSTWLPNRITTAGSAPVAVKSLKESRTSQLVRRLSGLKAMLAG